MFHQIIEAESQSNSYWTLENALGRDVLRMTNCNTGSGILQWGLGNTWPGGSTDEVAQSRLFYDFTIPADGVYAVCVCARAWNTEPAPDLNNDAWIRLETGSDAAGESPRGDDYHKFYRPNNSTFGWGIYSVGGRFVKNLSAGIHTVEIAARSCDFQIDRIVLWDLSAGNKDSAWKDKPAGIYEFESEGIMNCESSAWTNPQVVTKPLPASSLYNPTTDLLALHYDLAPDPDDIHSIAAGCNIMRCFNIDPCVVIGTYGENRRPDYLAPFAASGTGETMQQAGNNVASLTYDYLDTGGTDATWNAAVNAQAAKWKPTISSGGRVWIAEGGPMDFTADVMRRLLDLGCTAAQIKFSVMIIQHSGGFNVQETNSGNFSYVQSNGNYTLIDNGNVSGNSTADLKEDNSIPVSFRQWAESSACGSAWQYALTYYPQRLDFSDTVEILHILGVPLSSVSDTATFCTFFD